MSKMTTERAKAHDEMKRRALEVLDSLAGRDIHVGALRDRLGIPASSDDARVLSVALGSLRDDDHVADQGRKRGWWKRVQSGQQALPIEPAKAPALEDFEAGTIEALNAAILQLFDDDPKPRDVHDWMAMIFDDVAEAVRYIARDDLGRARHWIMSVANTALCAYEAIGADGHTVRRGLGPVPARASATDRKGSVQS